MRRVSRGMPNLAHHESNVVLRLWAPIPASSSMEWPFRIRTLRKAAANSEVEKATGSQTPPAERAGVSEEEVEAERSARVRASSHRLPQLPGVRPKAGATMGKARRLPGRAHLWSMNLVSTKPMEMSSEKAAVRS